MTPVDITLALAFVGLLITAYALGISRGRRPQWSSRSVPAYTADPIDIDALKQQIAADLLADLTHSASAPAVGHDLATAPATAPAETPDGGDE